MYKDNICNRLNMTNILLKELLDCRRKLLLNSTIIKFLLIIFRKQLFAFNFSYILIIDYFYIHIYIYISSSKISRISLYYI